MICIKRTNLHHALKEDNYPCPLLRFLYTANLFIQCDKLFPPTKIFLSLSNVTISSISSIIVLLNKIVFLMVLSACLLNPVLRETLNDTYFQVAQNNLDRLQKD